MLPLFSSLYGFLHKVDTTNSKSVGLGWPTMACNITCVALAFWDGTNVGSDNTTIDAVEASMAEGGWDGGGTIAWATRSPLMI
jgi:hypothetical protein